MGLVENVDDKELESIRRRKLEKLSQKIGKEGGERLKERMVIPTEDGSGLNARLSEHFGRSPYFTVVDVENGNISSIKAIPNVSEHFGGSGRPPDSILQLQPNSLITYGMGPKALTIFQQAGVAVLKANVTTVKEAVEAYREDKLQELTEGCHHARHR